MEARFFGNLVATHQEKTFAVAYRVLRDRDEALDILQETFLELFRRLASVPPESAGAWLARVATNRALDRIRRRIRERALRPASEREQTSPETVLLGEEERASVAAALEKISPQQHAVITRRFYEDLSFAEIGRELGIAEGSVKVHFRRALTALRTILERAPS